jgi:NAD-dependent deacetylase
MEQALADRFLLLTQNVDGLHLRAGSSAERTWQVHGNLHWMRCAAECTPALLPVPEACAGPPPGERSRSDETALLRCARCGSWMRPHVLWFDETYDEPRYRFESALEAAQRAALLIVVGTSGATNLAVHVGGIMAQRGAAIVDVDPAPNPFAALAQASPVGCFMAGAAAAVLPEVVRRCIAACGSAAR